jgi:hypothetical protein
LENIESVDGTASKDVIKPSHSKTKSNGKKKGGKKAPQKKPAASDNQEQAAPATPSQELISSKGKKPDSVPETNQEPDKAPIETREEMHDRLKNGTAMILTELEGGWLARSRILLSWIGQSLSMTTRSSSCLRKYLKLRTYYFVDCC